MTITMMSLFALAVLPKRILSVVMLQDMKRKSAKWSIQNENNRHLRVDCWLELLMTIDLLSSMICAMTADASKTEESSSSESRSNWSVV